MSRTALAGIALALVVSLDWLEKVPWALVTVTGAPVAFAPPD